VAKPRREKAGKLAAKKKEKKGERRTLLSRRVPSAPLSLSKARLSREEGDELERALMVFFPGKKQPNNDIKKSN
jgi:hypothetical protein